MGMFRVRHWLVAAVFLIPAVSSPALAQTPDPNALQQQIDQLKKEFGERIAALEAKLAEAQAAPQPPAPPPEPVAVAQAPATAGAKYFNPDMAVIGNFLGAAGHNEVNPSPAFEMRESEVSLQAIVDPYARADFFIAFGEEGVDLEEGFATLTSLPGALQVKAGKMRAAFGKVNTLHTHVLPWADRPLVINNLVGGEEGISDAGVSLSRLIPIGNVFFEATGQAFRGDTADDAVYKSSEPGDVSSSPTCAAITTSPSRRTSILGRPIRRATTRQGSWTMSISGGLRRSCLVSTPRSGGGR